MSGRTPKTIVFSIPFMPPSSNLIYVNKRGGGGRFLTTLADQYKTTVKAYLGEHYMMEISDLNPDGMYSVGFNFLMRPEDIFCKTFGNGKKNSAKSKYQKVDSSNRIKLLEDCLKDVTGIDDSQFFEVTASKWITLNPRVIIYMTEIFMNDVDADILAKSVLQNLSKNPRLPKARKTKVRGESNP